MSSKLTSREIDQNKVPQYGVGTTILMFAWPAAWYTLLIYVIGRQFIPEGGKTPTWVLLTIIALGSGKRAESKL